MKLPRLPFVSRLAFEIALAARDSERTRADRLEAELLKLRREGFTPARSATVREQPDEETVALQRSEDVFVQRMRQDDKGFIDRAAADLKRRNPSLSDRAAMQEAVRLRRSVTDEDPPS